MNKKNSSVCEYCKQPFEAKRNDAKYCSHSHRQLAYLKKTFDSNPTPVPPQLPVNRTDANNFYPSKNSCDEHLSVNKMDGKSIYSSKKSYEIEEKKTYLSKNYSQQQLPVNKPDENNSYPSKNDCAKVANNNYLSNNKSRDITNNNPSKNSYEIEEKKTYLSKNYNQQQLPINKPDENNSYPSKNDCAEIANNNYLSKNECEEIINTNSSKNNYEIEEKKTYPSKNYSQQQLPVNKPDENNSYSSKNSCENNSHHQLPVKKAKDLHEIKDVVSEPEYLHPQEMKTPNTVPASSQISESKEAEVQQYEQVRKSIAGIIEMIKQNSIKRVINNVNESLKNWLTQLLEFEREEETRLYKLERLFREINEFNAKSFYNDLPKGYKYLPFIENRIAPQVKLWYDKIRYLRVRYVKITLSDKLKTQFQHILSEIE